MKKAIAIATAITIAIIVSVSYAIPACAERGGNVYDTEAVIVGIELEPDCIRLVCLDHHGDIWEFYDEDEWHIGDVVILKMFAYDEDYTHDEIIDVEYTHSLELHELAHYILEVTGE